MGSARGPACCGIGSFCRGDDSEGHATFPFGHLGYRAGPILAADLFRWSCCGRVCGAGFVLSDDSIRWSCCGRSYGAGSSLASAWVRWSCCGSSYGAGPFLASAWIRWSCCGRSYGVGPFLAVALRSSASSKVLTSTGRPGLWWPETGRRGWPHGASFVSMMTCYLDFLVRGEYNDGDKKQK